MTTRDFLTALHNWARDHADSVLRVYAGPIIQRHVPVFVVGESVRFDFSFAGEVTALSGLFHETGVSVVPLFIPAVPDEELAGLMSLEDNYQVYPDNDFLRRVESLPPALQDQVIRERDVDKLLRQKGTS